MQTVTEVRASHPESVAAAVGVEEQTCEHLSTERPSQCQHRAGKQGLEPCGRTS